MTGVADAFAIAGRRRAARALAAAALALALGACGSFWPWSGSSKPKPPELPALSGAAKARPAWRAEVGAAEVGFAPAVAQDAVYAAARDGTVVKLDAASGRVVWRVNAGKRLRGGVGTDGQVVVVAASDGSLIALDGSGKPKWIASIGADVDTIPAVGQGMVIVRGSDNRVSAFDADSGERRWTFQRQNPTLVLHQSSSARIGPGTAYVGLPGGRMVALGLDSGAVRWEAVVAQPRGATEIERIADVVGTPELDGRDVCAATFQGRLGCFDAPSGRALWSRELSSSTGIAVDGRLVFVTEDGGQLQAFTRNGASAWKQDKLVRRGLTAPAAVGGFIAVGDAGGLVHVLARDDGSPAARAETDGSAIVGPPAVWRDLVVVQSARGAVSAISVE